MVSMRMSLVQKIGCSSRLCAWWEMMTTDLVVLIASSLMMSTRTSYLVLLWSHLPLERLLSAFSL
jgi:hypothetical protein